MDIYRFHEPDPIFFSQDMRMTVQQMGGDMKENLIRKMDEGKSYDLVTINTPHSPRKFKEEGGIPDLKLEDIPNEWTNFLRSDTWTSITYFYLDKPSNNLKELPNYKERKKLYP